MQESIQTTIHTVMMEMGDMLTQRLNAGQLPPNNEEARRD